MPEIKRSDWNKTAKLYRDQQSELIEQESDNVTVKMAVVTCCCGLKRGLHLMYKCLYCDVYFCKRCAEQHFGKTVTEYRTENPIIDD